MQQQSKYATCLYEHEGWTTVKHVRALQPYIDTELRLNKRPGAGNSYVASHGVTAMLDLPEGLSTHAQLYNDVMSDVCSSAALQSEAVIARRNERERNRVRTINQTFARLRQHLPSSAAASVTRPATQHGSTKAKKLSKVQILRAAIHYIGQLQQLLTTASDDDDSMCDFRDADCRSVLSE